MAKKYLVTLHRTLTQTAEILVEANSAKHAPFVAHGVAPEWKTEGDEVTVAEVELLDPANGAPAPPAASPSPPPLGMLVGVTTGDLGINTADPLEIPAALDRRVPRMDGA